MNTAVNLNMVHEAEAQRQHARVKLPCMVHFQTKNNEFVETRLLDLSAGGFSFATNKVPVQVGDYYKGRLQFQLDSLDLGIDIEFQVRVVDSENNRIGCQYHNLKAREQSTLRYLISAYLGGELVTAGDLLSTLQRDNFTKARKTKAGGGGMGSVDRLRAVTFSLAIFLVGLAAFGMISKSLYDLYFVTHAEAGHVSVPSMQVTMPREGTVTSLVPENGVIAKGAPIATFSATMLEMLKGSLTDEQLTAENIELFFGKQLTGTLTSPCDCTVIQQRVADGQFASKGSVIFELAPRDNKAMVEARFRYRNFENVRPGTPVTLKVAGEDGARTGTIVNSSLHEGGLSSDIRVTIQPDQGLSNELAGRPVEVTISRGPSFDGLINKAVAAGL
ncbi:PilZ domain-containing protein [Pseudomonas borbori]